MAQLAAQRRLAEQQAGERRARVHLGVGQHPQLFELLDRQQVRLVEDEHDGLAALGGLGGEQLGRLRDQRRAVEARRGAQRADDLGVDPARPDRRVGQVDDRVAARVQAGARRSGGDGLAGADLAADDAERALADDPVDPRDGLLVSGRAEQHRRRQLLGERGARQPPVRPEAIDAHPMLPFPVVVVVGAAGRRAGKTPVVDSLLELALAALADQAEVVDPGRLSSLDRRLRARVHVALDRKRHRQPGVTAVEANLDLRQLQRVEDQLHPPAGEPRVDLVGVAVQPDRAGLRDGPPFRPAERFAQRALGRQRRRARGEEPLQRRLPGLRVHTPVIDRLDPRPEQPVELLEARGRAVLELDQPLLADGPKRPLDLPAPLGPPRPAVDQADPQHRARPQQLPGHERRAVVDIDGLRDAARGDPRPQRPRRVQHILAGRPAVPAQQAAVIVKEAEQERAATVDQRAMQGVPGPQLVAGLGLEAAQRARDQPTLPRQPSGNEVTLDRARRRRAALRLDEDPVDLRRRARRLLASQRDRQLQQPLRRPVRNAPRRRHQRVEPALPIRPDPAIQRVARHAHPAPVGPEMLPGRQRADQRSALPRRQRDVGRLADDPPAEQPDLLRPVHSSPPDRRSTPTAGQDRGHSGTGQGALVLIANKPPAVSADTHDHAGLDRKTSDASLVHTPIASSASSTSDCPAGGASDASSARAQRRKCAAIDSARDRNRRRQSRTVSPGTPSRSPARRYPSRPSDNSAAPITSTT